MQNKFKKGISIMLAVLMLTASVPMAGFAGIGLPAFTVDASAAIADGDIPEGTIASGTCGDNLTWELDSDGVLTISGTGDMYDYDGLNPWEDNYNELIKTIVLEDGVTSIGECAFWDCDSLTSITIPDSVTSIGPWAFTSCASLTSIAIPDSVTSIGDSAFSSCTSLISITLPENLTSIGDGAFSGCTSLISITLPENLTNIDDFTFMSCKSLTSITIPDSVTNIGAYAFDECNLLANIEVLNPECVIYDDAYTISDTATIYGYENSTAQEYAEKYDRTFISLGAAPGGNITDGDLPAEYGNASVVLESDWNIDENGRFYVDLYVDNSVGMGGWTFDLTFDESVITFYDWADGAAVGECEETKNNGILHQCGNAEDGKMRYGGIIHKVMWTPEDFAADAKTNKDANVNPYHCHLLRLYFTVNDLGDYSAQQIVISASGTVDYYGSDDGNPKYPAFDSKQTSTAIYGNIVPDVVAYGICGDNLTWTLDSTGLLTISGTGDMHNYDYSDENPWWSYTSLIQNVVIEDGVTSIGRIAFDLCNSLSGITIPDSVTSIGEYAFSGCSSLTGITIPNNVTSISDSAFNNCSSLTDITIPNSVKSIGNAAFAWCKSLTNITIPKGTTSIGDHAFLGCSLLTSITISDSVTSIGNSVFENCTSLTNITVDANNEVYSSDEYGALFTKDKTKLIQYPTGNTRTSYAIPSGVKTIGGSAFADCELLTSISIPDSVTDIGSAAFSSCASLTSINIPGSVTNIGKYAFYKCASITSITLPDSVASIDEYAFAVCSSLTDITILNPACVIPGSGTTISATATIHGYKNSTAQEYAEKYDRTFVALDEDVPTRPECEHIYSAVVTAPTCTEQGYTTYTCSCGDTYVSDYTPVLDHDYKASITAPTCTKGGYTTYACSRCDETYTADATEALGHDYKASVTAPTCTEQGYTTYTCSCGDTYVSDYTPVLDHDYKAVVTAPTCTEQGYTTYTCDCGDVYIADYVEENGHKHTATVTTPATHLAEGVMTYTCNCGDTYTETIAITTEHTYNSVVTAPTCTEQGYTTYTCSCGDTYVSDYTPVLDHDYKAVVTAPTCTAQGYTTYTCSCGDTYVDNYTAAKGHTEKTVPAVAPTCTKEGLTEGVICADCSTVLVAQKKVAKLDHVDEDTDNKCDSCGTKVRSCDCMCHATDCFNRFFYKIIQFFRNLFGIYSECKCGIVHR